MLTSPTAGMGVFTGDMANLPTRALHRMIDRVYEDLDTSEPVEGVACRYAELRDELEHRGASRRTPLVGRAGPSRRGAVRTVLTRKRLTSRPYA
ncbi:hypothetical protein MN0502_31240 [Arthrobacter sp. MN05-02]|nr:hypothetical protein MN0502_31240 [Arthrobacter sp. MN05-02]